MFRYHLLKASKRFLAPGKETVSVGRLPLLASYRTVSLFKTLSVNAVIWQVEGLAAGPLALALQTFISSQGPVIGSFTAAQQPSSVASLHPAQWGASQLTALLGAESRADERSSAASAEV